MLKYMCLVSRLSHESQCPLSLLWACAGIEQHPGGASSNSCSNAEYNEWLNMLLTGVSAMIVLQIAKSFRGQQFNSMRRVHMVLFEKC